MKQPATLTALRWEGELPRLGDFLKSERGHTAFRVIDIRLPLKPHARYVARLRCERWKASRMPADAVVHRWQWGSRERKQ